MLSFHYHLMAASGHTSHSGFVTAGMSFVEFTSLVQPILGNELFVQVSASDKESLQKAIDLLTVLKYRLTK